jgi:hypothetical protein
MWSLSCSLRNEYPDDLAEADVAAAVEQRNGALDHVGDRVQTGVVGNMGSRQRRDLTRSRRDPRRSVAATGPHTPAAPSSR